MRKFLSLLAARVTVSIFAETSVLLRSMCWEKCVERHYDLGVAPTEQALWRHSVNQMVEFGRFAAIPRGIEDGNIGQFLAGLNTTQHKATAAHISATDECGGKHQLSAKHFKQRVHILRGCDAT